MKSKRIMLLSHEMTYTGAPNSLLNLAILLKSHGNRISVFTLKPGDFAKEFLKKGICVNAILESVFNFPSLSGYDLIIANTIFCSSFAIKAQRFAPTVLYIREAQNLPDIISDCGLNSECLSLAENIVCVSEYAERFIRNNYNVKNLLVLHNFLNKPILYKPKKNISKDGKIHFLVAGTIEKRKGFDVALNALNLLSDDIRQQAVLHLAGKKPEWSRKYWEHLRFDIPGVVYHGEITDKRKMFRLYDDINCVIVTSIDESCSLTALEGAMHGRALIVTENVGAKYIVNGNGFIVKTGSAESLAEAMSFMVNNSSELEFMGKRSYKNFQNTSVPKIYYEKFADITAQIKE